MASSARGSGDLLDRCSLELRDPDGGATLGTGVLVDPDRVLTCCHVVGELQRVDLHDALSGELLSPATVEKRGDPKGADDLALLELDTTLPDRGEILFALWTRGDEFGTVGFPEGGKDHVRGEVDGLSHNDWIQIDPTGRREIEPGFSGGAVWVEAKKAAVGLVTHRDDDGVAYAITTEQIRDFWPQLRDAEAATRCAGHVSRVGRQLRTMEVRAAIAGADPEGAWREAASSGSEPLARKLCLETEPDELAGALCGAYSKLVAERQPDTAEQVFGVLMEALPSALLSRWKIELPDRSVTEVRLELLSRVLAEFALAAAEDAAADFHTQPDRGGTEVPRATHNVPGPGELGVDLDGDEAGEELAREVRVRLALDVGSSPESQTGVGGLIADLATRRHTKEDARFLDLDDLDDLEHASRTPEGAWRQPILNVLNERLAEGTSAGRRLYLVAGVRDQALVDALRRHLPELKIVTLEAPPEQFEQTRKLLFTLKSAFRKRRALRPKS